MRTLPTLLVLVSLALPAPAAPAQFFGPEVLASIGDDPPLGGSGETFNPYPFAGLVLKTSTAEDRAILEFDLTSLVGKTLTSAQLEGEINANTAADAGLRTFEFTLYPGNGSADLADYQAPGTVLGTGSYHPPNELAFEFAFDVAGALQPLLDAGTPFVGLRVRSTAGGPGASDTLAAYTHLLVQTLEPATVPGWTAQTGENHFASPKLADVDGDGLEDVVQTTSAQAGGAGTLRVWRGDGSPAPGFPVPLPSVSIATPAVGDVDGDGDPEIFVGLLNAVTAYDHTGLPVPGLSQGWSPRGFLLADIDGDGKLELVLGRTSGSLHAYEHDGTLKTTYSIPGSSKTSIPAVGDIDLDGDLEVLAGGQGSLAVWQDDATPLAGFPAAVCGDGTSAPLVADLDLDGDPEIVRGTACGSVCTSGCGQVVVLDHLAATVPGWPVNVNPGVPTPGAVADLDGDGDLEVAVQYFSIAALSHVVDALDPTGSSLPGFPVELKAPSGSGPTSLCTAGDIDGDEVAELLVQSRNTIFAFDGTGASAPGFPRHLAAPTASSSNNPAPAIGDPDGDGRVEVVAVASTDLVTLIDTLETIFSADLVQWPSERGGATSQALHLPPELAAFPHSLPVSTGGAVALHLRQPGTAAGRPYLVVLGGSGTIPGTPAPGGLVTIPIQADGLTDLALASLGSPLFPGFLGNLDGTGQANAALVLGFPLPPSLIGTRVDAAYALLAPIDVASNPVGIVLTP